MNLREARKIKTGDKVRIKKTGEICTVERALFGRKGIGYSTDCMIFDLKGPGIEGRYVHSVLAKVD